MPTTTAQPIYHSSFRTQHSESANALGILREFIISHEGKTTPEAFDALNRVDAFLRALGEDLTQLHVIRWQADTFELNRWLNDRAELLLSEVFALYNQSAPILA